MSCPLSSFRSVAAGSVALAGLALLVSSGCVAPSFGSRLNARQAQEIGAEAAVQIDSQFKPADPRDPGIPEFERAAQLVAAHATRLPNGAKLRFAAIESGEEIAVSLPDGHVYVSSGLLAEAAPHPDEIGCLLAHEAGHVALAHDTQNLSAALGESNVQDMLAQGKYQEVVNIELQLGRLSYTTEQEYQADRYTVQLARACGYDATAWVRFLSEQSAEHHGSDSQADWDESHPISKTRIGRVQQDISALRR